MNFIRQPWETEARLRIFALGLFFLAAFFVLLGRLYYLQLYHGEEHRQLVKGQMERLVRISGMRGRIYTDDGLLLAGNRAAYDMVFYPKEMRRGGRKKSIEYMTAAAKAIGEAIGRNNPPEAKDFQRHLRISPALPMVIFRDLKEVEKARAYEAVLNIPGADVQSGTVRVYPEGRLAAGIIGFARLTDGDPGERREYFYYESDMAGREGVEKAFDVLPGNDSPLQRLGLRATPGRQLLQVNNVGFVHKTLANLEPVDGNDVYLTIDSRAQKIAAGLLGGQTGAIVVVDADNGDVICAVDSPTYDLSKFSPRLSPEYYQSLQQDSRHPLINRSFRGIYQPGSTLKPLICLALLNSGIDPQEKIPCDGGVQIGNAAVRCQVHRKGGAELDMYLALEKSCNGYLMQRALQVGPEVITAVLDSANLGRHTGLEIPDSAGDFPSDELKRRRYHTRWNRYDTALLSIGQGIISVTPLQMALVTAALFNDGARIWRPHVVRSVIDKTGNLLYSRRTEETSRLAASPEALAVVREGMRRVVNSGGGSGKNARVDGLAIYGKTGTAETGSRGHLRNITHFIAFTAYRGRRYAMAVTVENGASGGKTCAPLAAGFFQQYLLSREYRP